MSNRGDKNHRVAVKRPSFGQGGQRTSVYANFFALQTMPGSDIHHQDLTVNPEPTVPALFRKIWEIITNEYSSHLKGIRCAFDGRRNIYTPKPLAEEGQQVQFEIELKSNKPDREGKKFRITIKRVAKVSMQALINYVNGQPTNMPPYESIQALDVILRQHPAQSLTIIGNSAYSLQNTFDLGRGVVLARGYFSSVRPAKARLLVNVDLSATAFVEGGKLVDYIAKVIGRRKPFERGETLSPFEQQKGERSARGVRVTVTHRQVKRAFKIIGFSKRGANETTFTVDSEGGGGKTMSIEDYFRSQYKKNLDYGALPCVNVGSRDREIFLPMEVCEVVPGQRYMRKLDGDQTASMIKQTCQRPQQRLQQVVTGLRDFLGYGGNEFIKDFGITVKLNPEQINARVIAPPTIMYGRQTSRPQGSWDLRNVQFSRGAKLQSFGVLCFGAAQRVFQRDTTENFVNDLLGILSKSGLTVQNSPVYRFIEPDSPDLEKQIKAAYKAVGDQFKIYPQLLLCLLPEPSTFLYAQIKRIGETIIGVPSQCCIKKHMGNPRMRAKPQYLCNVATKINMKLGGRNQTPSQPGPQNFPRLGKDLMCIGADVTHQRTMDTGIPSIAAVVGSMDAECTQYQSITAAQSSREEVIADMQGAVVHLLKTRLKLIETLPQTILYFRDGVSEGQFHQVMNWEIKELHKACQSVEPNYKPKITFMVVQKRHHARFFPTDRRDVESKSGNVQAGTCVDSDVTHSTEWDWYTCSHSGLQGTSRPAHFHVLMDENEFSPDELQMLSYHLCYLYGRATKSVSIPPPVYYAHLVAARARLYMSTEGSDAASTGSGRLVASYVPVHERLKALASQMFYV